MKVLAVAGCWRPASRRAGRRGWWWSATARARIPTRAPGRATGWWRCGRRRRGRRSPSSASTRRATSTPRPAGYRGADGGADFERAPSRPCAAAGPAPGSVFAAWRHDPHRDHTASFAIAAAALRTWPPETRFFAYPVWGLAFAHPIPGFPLPEGPLLPAPPRGLRLDVARHLPAKRRAVAAHASQVSALIDDDPGGFRLPEAALDLAFRPFELFLEAEAG